MSNRFRINLVAGLTAVLLQICGFCATTNQTVLPLGLESQEGSTRDSVLKGGPAERNIVISSGALPLSWQGPVIITGLAFRVDSESTFSFNAIVPRLEIRLSTTEKTPATMGSLYSQNAGPDSILAF